jgi:hypothetical protein
MVISDYQGELEFDIEKYSNVLKKFDDDGELELYSYLNCGNDSDEFVKKCRGLVVCNGKKLVNSIYTHEYVVGEHDEEIDKLLDTQINKCNIYNSFEGTSVRVFHHDKWYISTHRKLNAYKSKWSCEYSFGELFEQNIEYLYNNNKLFREKIEKIEGENIFERFLETLNKKHIYTFLLFSNKQNRIVCKYDEPRLLHIRTCYAGKYINEELLINKPQKLEFSSKNEVIKHIQDLDITSTQGLILFTEDNKEYKIVKKSYKQLYDIRGNQPSIKFRYIELRNDKEKVDKLYQLYPEYKDVFKEYENIFIEIAKYIYNSYVSRFIKKRVVTVPKEEYKVVREVHGWHVENRKENRINISKVIEVLNKQSPVDLNKMRRRYSSEIKKKEEYQKHNKFINTPDVKPLFCNQKIVPEL